MVEFEYASEIENPFEEMVTLIIKIEKNESAQNKRRRKKKRSKKRKNASETN